LRRIHPFKRGIRILGIAESFDPDVDKESTIAGVVMRKDLVVDGFSFAKATVGGDDATERILELALSFDRNDINAIMLSGAVISFYNMVDLDEVHEKAGVPLVCLTYRESKGLEEAIKKHFPDRYRRKVAKYRKLGRRTGVTLKTGKKVYVRALGLTEEELKSILDSFTLQGKYPEPVRVAGLLASACRKAFSPRT
jgi:endonuclease V-like protein UPF0215 family